MSVNGPPTPPSEDGSSPPTVALTKPPEKYAVSTGQPDRRYGVKEGKIVGRPWKKGESGNPQGRGLIKRPVTEAYRKCLDMGLAELAWYKPENAAEAVARRLILGAFRSRNKLGEQVMAIKEIAERVEGKVKQSVDVTSGGEGLEAMLIAFQHETSGTSSSDPGDDLDERTLASAASAGPDDDDEDDEDEDPETVPGNLAPR